MVCINLESILAFFLLLFFIFLVCLILFNVYWFFMKKSFSILDRQSLLEKFFEYIIKIIKKRNNRIKALKAAEKYIKPYENIFSNLILANKFCIIKLDYKNKSIRIKSKVFDKNGEKLAAEANKFKDIDENDCFNHLCTFFGYKTTYEEGIEIISQYSSVQVEVVEKKAIKKKPYLEEKKSDSIIFFANNFDRDFSNKIDINRSSESELIALPGINVVLAKKIIKYREEHQQFYSVDEFLRVMKIKPHFAKQLKNLVTVTKINAKKVKKAKRERIIDF